MTVTVGAVLVINARCQLVPLPAVYVAGRAAQPFCAVWSLE